MRLRLLFKRCRPVLALHRRPNRFLFDAALRSTAAVSAAPSVDLPELIPQHVGWRHAKHFRKIVNVIDRRWLLAVRNAVQARLIPHISIMFQASCGFGLIQATHIHQGDDARAKILRGFTVFHCTSDSAASAPSHHVEVR